LLRSSDTNRFGVRLVVGDGLQAECHGSRRGDPDEGKDKKEGISGMLQNPTPDDGCSD
jgi:hypothetical protein